MSIASPAVSHKGTSKPAVLLASDSKSPLKVVTIHGSQDGLATPAKIADSLKLLSSGTTDVLLDGGNHAQYGNYGPQAGDGVATMSREEQQRLATQAVVELAQQLK